MKITAISDLHGNLPQIPDGDVLIISGDICPATRHNKVFQKIWIENNFIPWLNARKFNHKVFIFGNHDFIGMDNTACRDFKRMFPINTHLLNDSEVIINGTKIYGTSWVPQFYDWAFMKEDVDLIPIYANIPMDTNVLVTHGPPYGILDAVKEVMNHPIHGSALATGKSLGSRSLRNRVDGLPALKVHIFGHIHSGHGVEVKNGCTFVNASILGESYNIDYDPEIIDK